MYEMDSMLNSCILIRILLLIFRFLVMTSASDFFGEISNPDLPSQSVMTSAAYSMFLSVT